MLPLVCFSIGENYGQQKSDNTEKKWFLTFLNVDKSTTAVEAKKATFADQKQEFHGVG